MSWLPPKKFVLGCSVLVLLIFLACVGAAVWWFNATDNVGYVSPDFCTVSDELYQTINEKALYWLTELSQSNALIPVVHFSTPSGREYVASKEMHLDEPPYIFVTVQKTHLQIRMGTRGYMYAISGKLPDFDPVSVNIKYVGEKIYCYEWLKD